MRNSGGYGLDIKNVYYKEIVPSVDKTRQYFIACSDVDWNDGKGLREKVIYILVIRNGQLRYYPAHILPEDIDEVFTAINRLKEKCKL
jgi:hypothetical protein